MSLATTAILASAIRPKSDRTPATKTTSITESIAQRPIQWLIVAGAVVYFGGKFIKNVIPTGEQKIPIGTNLITSAGAFQQAKKVYDALNTYFSDDADIVVGVFAALPSKVQVALVVKSFEAYYKRNILEYLKSGKKTFDFGTGGISDALYNRIIENVKRKPKF
jgi:hypothetical protein